MMGWLTCSPWRPLCSRWAGWSFSRLRMLGSAPRLSSSRRISAWWGLPWRPAAMCKAVWPWAYREQLQHDSEGLQSGVCTVRQMFVHSHRPEKTQAYLKSTSECHVRVGLTFKLTKSFMFCRGILSRYRTRSTFPSLTAKCSTVLLLLISWNWELEVMERTEWNHKTKPQVRLRSLVSNTKERLGRGKLSQTDDIIVVR